MSFDFPWYLIFLVLLIFAAPYVLIIIGVLLSVNSIAKNHLARLTLIRVFLPQSMITLALWWWLENAYNDIGAIQRSMTLVIIIAVAIVWFFTPRAIKTNKKPSVYLGMAWGIFAISLACASPSYYKLYAEYQHSRILAAIHSALDHQDVTDLKHQLSRMDKYERYEIFKNAISKKYPESVYRLLVKAGMDPFYSRQGDTTVTVCCDTGIHTAFSETNVAAATVFLEGIKPFPQADKRRDAILSSGLLYLTLRNFDDASKKSAALTLAELLLRRHPELIKNTDMNSDYPNIKTLSDRFIYEKNLAPIKFLEKHGDTVSAWIKPFELILLGQTDQLINVVRRDPFILIKARGSNTSIAGYVFEYGKEDTVQKLLDTKLIHWDDFKIASSDAPKKEIENWLLDRVLRREEYSDNTMSGLVGQALTEMVQQKATISDRQLVYLFQRLSIRSTKDKKTLSIQEILGPSISCDRLQNAFKMTYQPLDGGYNVISENINSVCLPQNTISAQKLSES